jgi:hypothetical protein
MLWGKTPKNASTFPVKSLTVHDVTMTWYAPIQYILQLRKKIFKNLLQLKMFATISRNLVKKLLMPRCGRGGM